MRPPAGWLRWVLMSAALASAAVAVLALIALSGSPSAGALAHNPYLDPGARLSGRPAPDVTLTDQSGRRVSLRSYRGKVVMLAFTDAECTTVCPLTTVAMLDAQRMLGRAGSRVQLLGIDANPSATSVKDVLHYTEVHGMLGRWRFLTGALPALRRVWREFGVAAGMQHGSITHTPALVVIDPQGRLQALYLTQQSYSAVGQLAQLLAREASRLLPGHPRVRSDLPYSVVPEITPAQTATVPSTTGRSLRLGPSGAPHLYLFFATWDREITDLRARLDALDRYGAGATGLPRLTAVDEGSVEPSPGALPRFLATLARPLSYPVAIDRTGRVADGYQVQGQPWFVLISATGQILWYRDVVSQGWPRARRLAADVRAALARTPGPPATPAAARRMLRGSPPALAALHAQSGRLLGSETALAARIRTLRGYPIVLNVWASWCPPCAREFKLFSAASAEYGRRIAFLGADTEDSPGDARAFLAHHPVSYPSYQPSSTQLRNLAPGGLQGLPTTIYIDSAGKVTDVHVGQYSSQGDLNADVQQYAGLG
jgi:cytochrome oxidase Cu insertion factor (SCO1/SenC/PrrC family)/thiol-disulfide isomerase/thioredoxin